MAGVGRWRVVLAGLLTLPLVVLGAPVASAQVGSWYLPQPWVDVLAGTWEAARDLLTHSGTVAVEPGGSIRVEYGTVEPVEPTGYAHGVDVERLIVDGRGASGMPIIKREYVRCIPGTVSSSNCINPATYNTSAQGMSGTVYFSQDWPSAPGFVVNRTVLADGTMQIGAADVPWIDRITINGTLAGADNFLYPTTIRMAGAFTPAVTTASLVCRSSSGDETITEASAPGATVAPAPVCPAGSYPVRLTVTNSATGVVSDASINAPGWYMGDPQSWEFEKFQKGLRCVDGTPTCDAVWDEDTDSCMAYNHTTGEYREVVDAVCQGAAGDGFLSGGGAAETPEDPDQGIINRSLEAIRSAIDKAKTAIVGGLVAAARTVAGAVDAVRSAVSSAADQAAADAAAARAKLDSILDGIAGLGQAVADLPGRIGEALTPSSGAMGAQIGRMGDAVTGKFAPWTAVAEDYAGAFAVSGSCSCLGPPLKLPAAMGGHTVYPASSCGHLAPFAAASKTFTAAVLLVGCAAAVLHFLMTAFGFVSPIGRAAARVGGPGAQAGRGTLDSSGTVSYGTVDWDLIADRDASIPKSQRDASPLWKS